MPLIEPSYVFGEKPDGGQLVVGVLLPWMEPRVIAEALPPDVFEEFVRTEAARDTELKEIEEEEPEIFEAPSTLSSAYRKQAQSVAKALGVRILLREIAESETDRVAVVIGRNMALGDPDALLAACKQAIQESPLVRHLASDPTGIVEARREEKDIVVQFAAAPEEARHANKDGESLWKGGGSATLRFEAPPDALSMLTDRLVVRWRLDGFELRRSFALDELVGIVDREILCSPSADVGGRIALRAIYRNSKTLLPVSGQHEEIRLVSNAATLARTAATSDADGVLVASLLVPEDAEPGSMELDFGDAKIPVSVRRDYRVSIVTDRTLYRPNDTVHARVLVHHSPSGRPAAALPITLTHVAGHGRKSQRIVKTSAHGIASWSIALADAPAGKQTVSVQVGDATAKAGFKVEAFEKPLFTLDLEPSLLELRPGEQAPVVLRARFFNGAPMAGAEVHIGDTRGFSLTPATGHADADGVLRFTVTAAADVVSGRSVIEVKNADGRTEKRTLELKARTDPATRIAIRSTGDLVVGLPCTFAISGGEPGATLLCALAGSTEQREVVLNDMGAGAVEFIPNAAGAVKIVAGREFAVGVAAEHLVRPDHRVVSVGDTLGLSLRGSNGPVCIDLLRERQLIHTCTAPVQAGAGRVEIPLTADLAGVLTIHAYRLGLQNDMLQGSHVRVLVRRDDGLAIRTQSDREVYRPGETARVDVAVTDGAGNGVATALGYWAVDEAILALRAWDSGYETVFDALPPDAPRALAQAAERGSEDDIRSALGAISSEPLQNGVRVRHRRLPDLTSARNASVSGRFQKRVGDLRRAYYEYYERIPFDEIRAFGSFRQQLAWLVEHGHLDPELLIDPWGSPLVLSENHEYGWVLWTSHGPNLQPDTIDDLNSNEFLWNEMPSRIRRFHDLLRNTLPAEHPLISAAFWGPTYNATIGLGGGAGGGFRGRSGSRNLRAYGGSAYAPAPTRRDFPPTLVFVPELLTGPDGRASLSIPLADSITTWRMRLVASSATGATGVNESTLRVSQPLHLDPWLAPHLTEGDTLDLPVSVRNETEAPIRAEVRLEVTDHLRIVGDARAEVLVGARGTGACTFRIRAVKPGKATVRIETASGSERDAVARIVNIRRDANEVVRTVSSQIVSGATWTPKLGVPDRGTLRLDLYPSPLADTIAGIDGLIREPHG